MELDRAFTGIMGTLSVVLEVFLFEESYRPIILTRKARELRLRTGNWGIYAPHELGELDLRELVQDNLNHPINMLVREPILFLISLYTGCVYGVLCLLLESYPIIFAEGYGRKAGVAEVPY